MYNRMTHRIKHQHPAEEVDSFMGCLARQCIQNRKGWLQTKQASQHHPSSHISFSFCYTFYTCLSNSSWHFLKTCRKTALCQSKKKKGSRKADFNMDARFQWQQWALQLLNEKQNTCLLSIMYIVRTDRLSAWPIIRFNIQYFFPIIGISVFFCPIVDKIINYNALSLALM